VRRKAVILAGGRGQRLRPYTFVIPKPLIPIGEKPIVELLLRHLASEGVTDAYLATGYGGDLIQTYFGSGRRVGLNMFYLQEDKRLGTAGPVRMIRDRFGLKESFLVINADIVTRVSLARLFDTHRKHQAVLTVGVYKHQQVLPFGQISIDQHGRVTRIEEKPTIPLTVNTGIYVMRPDAVDGVLPDSFLDMPDLAMGLLQQGRRVQSHEILEPWCAIENEENWRRMSAELAAQENPEGVTLPFTPPGVVAV
jgi:NDP-sugar pyrophosphorylase family protein